MTSHAGPHRRYRLAVIIESDDWSGITSELNAALFRIEEASTPSPIDVASGGSHSSRIQVLDIDPEQTHEKYFEQIQTDIALGRPAKGLPDAVLRFRAAGGTPEQLDVLARMAARGRIYVEDLAALEANGIKLPRPAD